HVAAFAIVFVSSEPAFALLEYMAVRESDRGRGRGACLFRDTIEILSGPGPALPVLIEVESEGPGDAGHEERRRRQAFYRRLGCRRVEGLRYILPLETNPPPPEMEIMIHIHTGASEIPRHELGRWLGAVYQRVYARPGDDARIEQMLKPL